MSTSDDQDFSAAELIRRLREYGLTQTEIARELDRSPRMVRKIERGETSGELYRGALAQLYETGKSVPPVPRRRDRAGSLVRVRAPRGSETPTVQPVDPTSGPARRNYSTETTYLQGGGRQHQYHLPKSEGKGREEGRLAFLHNNGRAAMGRRRAKFRLRYSNGRTVEVGSKGGYRASDVQTRSRNEGNDPWAYLAAEAAHRYVDLDDPGVTLVDVEVTYF